MTGNFFLLKQVDFLTSVVHFCSRRMIFLCVWWSALICSLLFCFQSACHCSFCLAPFPTRPFGTPPRELLLTCSLFIVCCTWPQQSRLISRALNEAKEFFFLLWRIKQTQRAVWYAARSSTELLKHSRSRPPSLRSQGGACVCRRPRTSLVFRRGRTGGPGVWEHWQLFSPRSSRCLPAAWGQPARRNPARSEWPAGTPVHGRDNLGTKTDI